MEGYSSVMSHAMSLPSAGKAKAMPSAVYLETSPAVSVVCVHAFTSQPGLPLRSSCRGHPKYGPSSSRHSPSLMLSDSAHMSTMLSSRPLQQMARMGRN